ncbi:MAG TPA: SDR family oxidoreductase [Polyangiaceae bacterium]|jgi:NAD(P)-dependent dehydrogenase (short-subunit alcohol dehydrogenase family)
MLKSKRLIVLGGSAGIGFAVAKLAAREGMEVVVASHDGDRVARAVAELRAIAPSASGRPIDLRAEPAIRAFFETVGRFDHLVYTAGEELLITPLAQLDLARARAFFELRYWGALAAMKAAQPYLAKDGSIVLTSGAAGRRPHPGFVIGASICSAMEAVTRTLAVELAPIRVNIVTPGFVDTGLWSNVPSAAKEQMFREAAAKLPVGRIGTADDIAEHYVSFMRGGYVTGQALVVDGGGVLV